MSESKNIKKFKFKSFGDESGWLVPIEASKDIPFEIKRIYYIYDTTANAVRGKHAHIDLEQVLVCLNGGCTIVVDDGKECKEVILSQRTDGLYIGNNVWREMKDFSKDCVLLVLASKYFEDSQYIRDYEEFLAVVGG